MAGHTEFIRESQGGFTVVELMVTLAVMIILLAVGMPSARHMIDSSELTTASNDLVTALHFARNKAVTKGIAVGVCPSSDGASCSNSTDWNNGWMVFEDGGSPGTRDATDQILRLHGPARERVSITGSRFVRYTALGGLDLQY